MWDDALGIAIEILPVSHLPKTRTILQRYRFIRINQPLLETNAFSRTIAGECIQIWNRARIPTKRMQSQCQAKLEELFYLAPKPPGRGGNVEKENEFLRKLMCYVGKPKATGFNRQESNAR